MLVLLVGILLVVFSGPIARAFAKVDDSTPSALEGLLNVERAERIAEARRDNAPQAWVIRLALVVIGVMAVVAAAAALLE